MTLQAFLCTFSFARSRQLAYLAEFCSFEIIFLGIICKCRKMSCIFARQLINQNQKTNKMKKLFFAFVAISALTLVACGSKTAETTDAAATEAVESTETAVEEAAVAVDSTNAAAIDSAVAK